MSSITSSVTSPAISMSASTTVAKLSLAIEKPADRPPIITISGDAGLGKTSLAATFPKPIFIRAEDGLQSIPLEHRPDAFPLIHKVEDLWDQLSYLKESDHGYKTLVIDSVTELEKLFTANVINSDRNEPMSINQALGGYGAGPSAVGTLHSMVRKRCGYLNEYKGMNIIFVAHADLETMDLPDVEQYSRYSLRLGKKSISPYIDGVDLVGFIRQETFVTGDGKKEKVKTTSTERRILSCQTMASSVAKNRYGITKDIPVVFGKNPLIDYIPTLKTKEKP